MAYEYWIKTDDDNEPEWFYRYKDGLVEVWYEDEWHDSPLSRAEMSGMGGSADYRYIAPADNARAVRRFSVSLNHSKP